MTKVAPQAAVNEALVDARISRSLIRFPNPVEAEWAT